MNSSNGYDNFTVYNIYNKRNNRAATLQLGYVHTSSVWQTVSLR